MPDLSLVRPVLVLGYGNPGRMDDGLGPEAAERIGDLALPGVSVDANYQLQVEDATAVAEHELVIFVDASVSGPSPFFVKEVSPKDALGGRQFSSHSLDPASVLGWAHSLFGAKTAGFILGIRGYEFDGFAEGLSGGARENLDIAVSYLATVLRLTSAECGEKVARPPGRPASDPLWALCLSHFRGRGPRTTLSTSHSMG